MVEVDSSLREMIHTGGERYDAERLGLLADLRDEIRAERNLEENRVIGRDRRGRVLVQRDGETLGVGPSTMAYRKSLLQRVLDTQAKFNDGAAAPEVLISEEEISHIHSIWAEEEVNLAKMIQAQGGGV